MVGSDIEDLKDVEESKSTAMEFQAAQDSDGFIPKDFFEYKTLVLRPNSERLFPDMVDKDVVLANLSEKEKPSVAELKFLVGTIDLVNNVFVEEKEFYIPDEKGDIKRDANGNAVVVRRVVFDDEFAAVKSYLMANFKFAITSTRAMGDKRAAILDVSKILGKNVEKKKEQRNFGSMGGVY